jgi:hypothetical protein
MRLASAPHRSAFLLTTADWRQVHGPAFALPQIGRAVLDSSQTSSGPPKESERGCLYIRLDSEEDKILMIGLALLQLIMANHEFRR